MESSSDKGIMPIYFYLQDSVFFYQKYFQYQRGKTIGLLAKSDFQGD